jgi:hypothetical protein
MAAPLDSAARARVVAVRERVIMKITPVKYMGGLIQTVLALEQASVTV